MFPRQRQSEEEMQDVWVMSCQSVGETANYWYASLGVPKPVF